MKLKPIKATTAEHALLSPSAAKKWLGCPASLACEVGIQNESGAAAVNGTTMHTMAEKVLKAMNEGSYGPSFGVETWFMSSNGNPKTVITDYGKGDIAASDNGQPGNVEITDDFVSQVSKYVNYCAPIMAAAEVVEIESRVSLTRILHPGFRLIEKPEDAPLRDSKGRKRYNADGELLLQTFGTADFVALLRNPDGTYTLIVGDLKTGRHKVTAAENKQMMLYALGLLRKYRLSYDISAVKLFIFQPYAGGADEWDTTPTALEHFAKFASKQALKALDAYQRGKKGLTPADFRPSNDACQWCRFSEKCNAKVKAASHTMDEMADIGGLELTPEVLKAEWDKLPLMRQHIADIEKAMYTHLMAGKPMDGLKLVEGRPGNRAWADVDKVELETLDYSDVMHKSVLLSPTEAEKAHKGTALWTKLEPLVTRKPGQPSIAAADDKRPAWTPVSDEDLA
ncbi:MAG: DUF2800 domain-containing protein [Aeromonas veronii]